MSAEVAFTKGNLDDYLRMLAKEFRKRNGKVMPAEIILIGGASVLINYGFREKTYDFDAIIRASSAMKDAINYVGDENQLQEGWLNSDFTKTNSYSPKLVQYSTYYKTFSNILTVRTISKEYLVAMKLRSFRTYKNDLSDIVGIYREQMELGDPLTKERVEQAVVNLYQSWDSISENAQNLINRLETIDDFDTFYDETRKSEIENEETLMQFEGKYPNKLNDENVDSILKSIKQKAKKPKGPKL
ncbi:MAG TPA: hypothetical protein DHV88_12775 [Roseburia sp.]|nr:hypothetical protein [Roseburia sp.]